MKPLPKTLFLLQLFVSLASPVLSVAVQRLDLLTTILLKNDIRVKDVDGYTGSLKRSLFEKPDCSEYQLLNSSLKIWCQGKMFLRWIALCLIHHYLILNARLEVQRRCLVHQLYKSSGKKDRKVLDGYQLFVFLHIVHIRAPHAGH